MPTSITLTYQTEYEHGKGVETFVYFVKDNSVATLGGWHINSNDLIVTPSSTPAPTTP